jgi:hypothetical protein
VTEDGSFIDHTYSFQFANQKSKFKAKKNYKLMIDYEGNISSDETVGVFVGIDNNIKNKHNFYSDNLEHLRKRYSDEIYQEIKENT